MKKLFLALAAVVLLFSCDKDTENQQQDSIVNNGGSSSGAGGSDDDGQGQQGDGDQPGGDQPGGGDQPATASLIATDEAQGVSYNSATLYGRLVGVTGDGDPVATLDGQSWGIGEPEFLLSKDASFPQGATEHIYDFRISRDHSFYCQLRDLTPNTTYYFKAVCLGFSLSGGGERWFEGEVRSFKTAKQPRSTSETGEVVSLTEISAVLSGYANPRLEGAPYSIQIATAEWDFLYYQDKVRSFPGTGRDSEDGYFTIEADGLDPNTQYWYRTLVADSDYSIAGDAKSFKTPALRVEPQATGATDISEYAVTLNGKLKMNTIASFTPEVYFLFNRFDGSGETKIPCEMASDSTFSYRLTGLNLQWSYAYKACATVAGKDFQSERCDFSTLSVNGQFGEGAAAKNVSEFGATLSVTFTADTDPQYERVVKFYYAPYDPEHPYADLATTGTEVVPTLDGDNLYQATLTELTPDTRYRFMAVATVLGHLFYDTVKEFSTPAITLQTLAPAEVRANSALLKGKLSVTRADRVWFEVTPWGWTYEVPAELGTDGSFEARTRFNLTDNADYTVTAYAQVDGKKYQGETVAFKTLELLAELTEGTAADILERTATLKAKLSVQNDEGVDRYVGFYFSTDEAKVRENRADAEGAALGDDGTMSLSLSDLAVGTTYYFKPYIFFGSGGNRRFYGEMSSFTTLDVKVTFSGMEPTDVCEDRATLRAVPVLDCRPDPTAVYWFYWTDDGSLSVEDMVNGNGGNWDRVSLAQDGSLSRLTQGLKPSTDYWYFARASVHYIGFVSEKVHFRTPDIRAELTALPATDVQYTCATFHGTAVIGIQELPYDYSLTFIYGAEGTPESGWRSVEAVLQGDGTYTADPYVEPGVSYACKMKCHAFGGDVYSEAVHFTTLAPTASVPAGAVRLLTFARREDGTQYEIFWADRNLGAASEDDYGNLYTWGDITAATHKCQWPNYKWLGRSRVSGTYAFKKYCAADKPDYWDADSELPADGKLVLDPEDDAAHVELGGDWRMPLPAELLALSKDCDFTWVTHGDVKGAEVRSKSSACSSVLFLPAAGEQGSLDGVSLRNMHGYYWSSHLNGDNPRLGQAYALTQFGSTVSFKWDTNAYRYLGYSIRPVIE